MKTTNTKAAETLPAAKAYRLLGTTEEITSCDCCGRDNLKKTVRVMLVDRDGNFEANEPLHFGVVCASKAARVHHKAIKRAIDALADARREARLAASRAHPLTPVMYAEIQAANKAKIYGPERIPMIRRWQQMSREIEAAADAAEAAVTIAITE